LSLWLKRIFYIVGGLVAFASVATYFFGPMIIGKIDGYFDSHIFPSKTNGLPLDYYHQIISVLFFNNAGNFSIVNPHVLIFLVVLGLFVFIIDRLRSDSRRLAQALICLVVFNLLSSAFSFSSLASKKVLLDPPQFASFITAKEKDPYNYRVFSFLAPFAQYQKILAVHPEAIEQGMRFAVEALESNMNLLYGVPTVGGVDANSNRRAHRVVDDLEGGRDTLPLPEKIAAFLRKTDVLSAMNVKYVVSPYELVTDKLVPVKTIVVTDFKVPLYLYENPNARPTIFLPSKVTYLKENAEDASFNDLLTTPRNSNLEAFIECDHCDGGVKSMSFSSDAHLAIVDRRDGYAQVRVTSPEPRWLVFSETYSPGWKAFIDDVPVPIYFADHVFQSLLIPAGEHTIIFRFSPL